MLRIVYPSRFVGWAVSITIMMMVVLWGGVELYLVATENEVSAKALLYSTTLVGKIDSRTSDYAGEIYSLQHPRSWNVSTEGGRARLTSDGLAAFIEIILHKSVDVSLDEFSRISKRRFLSRTSTSVNGLQALKINASDGEHHIVTLYVSVPSRRVLEITLFYMRGSREVERIENIFNAVVSSLVIKP